MTGFGKANAQFDQYDINVQVKTLNSKGIDINLKTSSCLKDHEMDFRNILSEQLIRGKIDCTIQLESAASQSKLTFDKTLAKSYLKDLSNFADKNNLRKDNLLSTLLKMPEVLSGYQNVKLSKAQLSKVNLNLSLAIRELNDFRKTEGEQLEKDILYRCTNIGKLLEKVKKIDPERKKRVQKRLKQAMSDNEIQFDSNRFEQELIYYWEKMDISEEITRLETHCSYFNEIVKEKAESKGKKLGFVSQEMGREINTIGSKASDADIQKIVVQMKDELEKIKEQTANIL